MLHVTIECVTKIKGAGFIPVGVASQFTIDDKGNRKTNGVLYTMHPSPCIRKINQQENVQGITYDFFYDYYLI